MHVLEQVQAGRPAAVEHRDVALLQVEEVLALELARERREAFAQRAREPTVALDDRPDLGHRLDQRGVRVREQRRERLPGAVAHATSLMGIVRRFLPPKSPACDSPSEQPLPNENPQPPRSS